MIDSVNMSLSLPISKVEKLVSEINRLQKKGSATKKDLECIGGLMAHCSTVIHGGRTFSRRLYDLCALTPQAWCGATVRTNTIGFCLVVEFL